METVSDNEKAQSFPAYHSTPAHVSVTLNHPPVVQHPHYINSNAVKRSHCENIQKNNAQSNSVLGGVLLLFISGLHIAWGIWRYEDRVPWTADITRSITIFLIMCWYVFAVIGGIFGAFLVSNIRKKWIYYIGCIIMAISSLIFIIWYDSHVAIIIGRCLAGLAHGIVYNATITHAGENVIKELRGMLLSSINFITMSAMFTAIITIGTAARYSGSFSSDRIIGIIGLIFSVLSAVTTTFLTYESVPYLLRRDLEEEAVTNLLKLRNESVVTPEISNDLNDLRLMVSQDKQQNQNIISDGNGLVTAKMIGLRIMSNLSNNLLLNTVMMLSSFLMLNPFSYYMSPVILIGVRFGGALIPLYTSDLIGRRIFLTISGIGSGVMLLIISIILFTGGVTLQASSWLLPTLAILFQFFASIGIDPMQHVLLSEAFSTSKKAWSIACVTAGEYISQILLIGIAFIEIRYDTTIFIILIIMSFLLTGLAILLLWALPETLKKTLMQARDLFSKGFAQQYVVGYSVHQGF